ncbi:MFS transporter [Sphingosinicella sp. BN140058]|uniref:MFS transporter n=1 Tax=Sphingosinicella sp. BN140058 TaxID=1892855 RepID=UPI00197E8DF8|nr:MFS transporter [Sphingosinicella sp. BN140058]
MFVGQALSLIGSALTQFVLIWWITDTTGSVSALAIAGVVALLPQALLGPLGGTLADRWSRRAIMIAADLISAICMTVLIALFLTDTVALWHLFVMMFIRSAMQAFQQPAANASTAMLVPKSFLPRAAGLNQTLTGIMTVAAAPLGALAISLMPIGYALAIDVTTAVLGIVPLLVYSIPQTKEPSGQRPNLWREFREGFDFVWGNPGLRRLYCLLGAIVLVVMPSFTLVPLLVKEHFHGGASEVALIESVGGAGMIAGGLLVATVAPRRHVMWVLWGFAISCLSLALTALSPSAMFPAAVAWWALSGLTYIAGNAPFTALLQSMVPNHLQGRVLSLLATLMGLATPVGLGLATPLGELIGVRWLFVTLGILGAVVTLLGFLSPQLRNLRLSMGEAR